LGFRSELKSIATRLLQSEVVHRGHRRPDRCGFVAGHPAKVFSGPGALAVAVGHRHLFAAAGPWLAKRNAGQGQPRLALARLMLVAIYGGYFNGGLGILLMALYTLTGESD
jgi:uncharacterized protein